MTDSKGLFQMGGVLSGIRVVEQGTFITGPCAGMMLADLGADVIKVESPEGDPYRNYQGNHYSPHFQAYNRNKRSIALDLKQPAERTVFDGLVREILGELLTKGLDRSLAIRGRNDKTDVVLRR